MAILNPALLDRGVTPVFIASEVGDPSNKYQGWRNVWLYEDFQSQVWREFRKLTGVWPLASMALHHLGWLTLVASTIAGIFLGVRYGGTAAAIAWAVGLSAFLIIRLRLADIVLLWEWRRSRQRSQKLFE